jgi:hypothetical protein
MAAFGASLVDDSVGAGAENNLNSNSCSSSSSCSLASCVVDGADSCGSVGAKSRFRRAPRRAWASGYAVSSGGGDGDDEESRERMSSRRMLGVLSVRFAWLG